jgi:hypothetical protein
VLRCTKRDGENEKTERGSKGCSPREANGSVGGGCGSQQREMAVSQRGVLWLQEDDGKLHSDVPVLLPASIAVSGSESVAHDDTFLV